MKSHAMSSVFDFLKLFFLHLLSDWNWSFPYRPTQLHLPPNSSTTQLTLTSGSGFTSVPTTALPTYCAGIQPLGVTRNDLLTTPYKPPTLIFARGTTGNGNIGNTVGPPS